MVQVQAPLTIAPTIGSTTGSKSPTFPMFMGFASPRRVRGPRMGNELIREKFTEALDALVEQVKRDRSVLAAILCGSLSHDAVWAKSDIDLVLVTIDDKKVASADLALYADGVNVHAILLPRTQFRHTVEGAVHHSLMHSLLAKGRLLYTH